jgi:uncharacterized SAM-binding protein YcdF (DUF218 family)
MLILNKILPFFVLPFGVSLLLLLWGLFRRRRAGAVAALVVLLTASNPFVGTYLIRSVEQRAERRPVASVAPADAVVVLSAGRVMPPGSTGTTEWGDANRYFGGLQLIEAGRAPLLVFTGAWVWWAPEIPPEGQELAEYAKASGVPADQIAVTDKVGNTADEAREVARVLRDRGIANPRVILVTSAFHLPRARQQFVREGMTVDGFPVDFWVSEGKGLTVLDFLPSVDALVTTQAALRELYGRGFYWLQDRF